MRLRTSWLPIILLALAGCGGDDGIELMKGPFLLVDRDSLGFDTENGSGTYVGTITRNSLYLENRGDQALEITAITKGGQNPGAFTLFLPEGFSETSPIRLQSLERAFVQVEFAPTQAREYAATLTIQSNAANAATKEIPMSGKGFPPP